MYFEEYHNLMEQLGINNLTSPIMELANLHSDAAPRRQINANKRK